MGDADFLYKESYINYLEAGILDLLKYTVTSKRDQEATEDIQDGLPYRKHFGSDSFSRVHEMTERSLKSTLVFRLILMG